MEGKPKKLAGIFTKKRFSVLLSLTATPFIIFVITAIDLYLKNHIDLDDRLITVLPFVILFAISVLVGVFLYYYAKKSKIFAFLLLAYYLMGPAFFGYLFLLKSPLDNGLKIILFTGIFGIIAYYLYKKIEITKIVRVFFWLSIIVIVSELPVVYNGIQSIHTAKQKDSSHASEIETQSNTDLPNIYHVVFDEYQTDMFELTMNEEVEDQLAGFTFYPNTTTLYGRTGMSLPSIFTGLEYDYKMPQLEYQKLAFNSDRSLLFHLKKAGYNTRAYSHKIYTFDLELFDSFVEHNDNAQVQIADEVYIKLFSNLWAYANLPDAFSEKIIDPEVVKQIKAQNVLPGSAPVVNYRSFNNILANKELLDNSNQYMYIHLILPHFPYVLNPDCSYDENLTTPPLDQSKCATKMMTTFLSTLKELDRFEDSMIIIQSDHGARFTVENNELVSLEGDFYSEKGSLARARSTLLIKTPDRKSSDPFVVSDSETSLLDITPTIYAALGITVNSTFDGVSLTDPESLPENRTKYYHFFEKKGNNDLTDELSRYIIKNGKSTFDRKIDLGNIVKEK